MRTIGKIVFVDLGKGSNDMSKLPKEVQGYFKQLKGSSVPCVVIVSPDLTQKFGAFTYKQLKPQDYSKIFRDTKKKIRAAKKAGQLSSVGPVAVVEKNKVEKADVVTISSPKLEIWESKRGSEIKAKLIRVEHDDLFIFKTSNGKTLKVKSNQLAPSSVERVKALVSENAEGV